MRVLKNPLIWFLLLCGLLLAGAVTAPMAGAAEPVSTVSTGFVQASDYDYLESDRKVSEREGPISDSAGVPLDRYRTLPFDRGGPTDFGTAGKVDLINLFWGIWVGLLGMSLDVLNFFFGFEWLTWIVEPLRFLTVKMHEIFHGIGFLPLAFTLAAAVYGFSMMRGRIGHSLGNLLMSATLGALVTGLLMSPVSTVFGPEGLFTTAKGHAESIAGSVNTENENSVSVVGESFTAASVDVLIRKPAQLALYGQTLTGECDKTFTQAMLDTANDPTSQDAYKPVRECNEQTKQFHESKTIRGESLVASNLMVATFLLIVLITVALLLHSGIQLAWDTALLVPKLYMGIIPGSDRGGLWHALTRIGKNLLYAAGLIVLFVIMMNLLQALLDGLLAASNNDGNVLVVGPFLILSFGVVGLITYLRMNKKAEKAADWFSKTLGGSKPTPNPVVAKTINGTTRAIRTAVSLKTGRATTALAAAMAAPQRPQDGQPAAATTDAGGQQSDTAVEKTPAQTGQSTASGEPDKSPSQPSTAQPQSSPDQHSGKEETPSEATPVAPAAPTAQQRLKGLDTAQQAQSAGNLPPRPATPPKPSTPPASAHTIAHDRYKAQNEVLRQRLRKITGPMPEVSAPPQQVRVQDPVVPATERTNTPVTAPQSTQAQKEPALPAPQKPAPQMVSPAGSGVTSTPAPVNAADQLRARLAQGRDHGRN